MTEKKPRMTFEQALADLERIVEQIESGQIGLEESIARYEEGIALVKQCRAILDAAEKRIQLLARSADGEVQVAGELEESDGPSAGQGTDEPADGATGT